MKQLQCNFTTLEQSKRLLELGVPEWTADCCFSKSKDGEYICEGVKHIIPDDFCVQSVPFPAYPCWSVGRLIEIYLLCAELKKPQMIFIKEDVLMMDRMINELCYMAESERLDLSKLEL
jgi:hypothetical protein